MSATLINSKSNLFVVFNVSRNGTPISLLWRIPIIIFFLFSSNAYTAPIPNRLAKTRS